MDFIQITSLVIVSALIIYQASKYYAERRRREMEQMEIRYKQALWDLRRKWGETECEFNKSVSIIESMISKLKARKGKE